MSIYYSWMFPDKTSTIIDCWSMFIPISILCWILCLSLYNIIIVNLKVLSWKFILILNKILQRTKLLLTFTLSKKILIRFILKKWLNLFFWIHIWMILSPTRLSSDKHFFTNSFGLNFNFMHIRKSAFKITACTFGN